MKTSNSPFVVAIGLLLASLPPLAPAAEIEFKATAAPSGPLVRLRDVAVIRSNDQAAASQLADLELVLAPAVGERRYLRAREIQDLLAARGVHLADHRFLGAREVLLTSAAAPLSPSPVGESAAKLPPQTAAQLQQLAATAIERLLISGSESGRPWRVRVELTKEQLAQLATAQGAVHATRAANPNGPVTGSARGSATGSPSGSGLSQFVLLATDGLGREIRLNLAADVAELTPQVVAAHALPRGVLIRPDDVRIEFVEPLAGRRTNEPLGTIGDVVGREARQAFAPGQTIYANGVRMPILVRRNDEVQVFAGTGGVQVRTSGIAREEGSYGDLILVEMPYDRTKIYARVSGANTVEVLAASARATGAAPTQR